jgi:hypothetical protein
MTFQSGKMGDIRAVTNELPEVEKAKPRESALLVGGKFN